VLDCLAANYGMRGTLTRLPGENLNFLIVEGQGEKHVVKIVDEHMPTAVVEMESAAMQHAAKGGFQPHLPRIVENKYGNIETSINIHLNGLYRLRLIEFIDGTDMSELSDISSNLLIDLGKTIATFNRVMQDFDHPAAHRNHRWNLAEAEQHENKIGFIHDPEKRELLRWAFAAWRGAKAGLVGLPWQFIHGDAHDENVLVEGDRVAGLIDFGDCCHNPTVCDLAICLTYLMMRGEDPLRIAALVTGGYQAVRALSASEVSMLYPLICARLAVSVCVANKRKTIDPDNPNWFGGEGASWRLLRFLKLMGPEEYESNFMNE
jgi:Ser/Thr protein kinase RdoA (MazF antagonist)